jgi:hypothetical protein
MPSGQLIDCINRGIGYAVLVLAVGPPTNRLNHNAGRRAAEDV